MSSPISVSVSMHQYHEGEEEGSAKLVGPRTRVSKGGDDVNKGGARLIGYIGGLAQSATRSRSSTHLAIVCIIRLYSSSEYACENFLLSGGSWLQSAMMLSCPTASMIFSRSCVFICAVLKPWLNVSSRLIWFFMSFHFVLLLSGSSDAAADSSESSIRSVACSTK